MTRFPAGNCSPGILDFSTFGLLRAFKQLAQNRAYKHGKPLDIILRDSKHGCHFRIETLSFDFAFLFIIAVVMENGLHQNKDITFHAVNRTVLSR